MKERGKRDAMAKPLSQAEFAGLFSCNLHKTIFQPPVKIGFYEVSFRGQLVHRFRHSLLDCRCFKLQRLASLREYRRYLVKIFHHCRRREREREICQRNFRKDVKRARIDYGYFQPRVVTSETESTSRISTQIIFCRVFACRIRKV